MEKLIFKSICFVGEIMNFKKQIVLFSILAMSVMAVSAEDISTGIHQHRPGFWGIQGK